MIVTLAVNPEPVTPNVVGVDEDPEHDVNGAVTNVILINGGGNNVYGVFDWSHIVPNPVKAISAIVLSQVFGVAGVTFIEFEILPVLGTPRMIPALLPVVSVPEERQFEMAPL